MTSGREEDALSWGDDDPTLDAGGRHADADPWPAGAPDVAADAREKRDATGGDAAADAREGESVEAPELPAGWSAVGAGAETVRVAGEPVVDADAQDGAAESAHAEATGAPSGDEPPAMGNAALISLGVFGGVFVLYAIGWYLGATRLAAIQLDTGYGELLGVPVLADDLLYLFWVILATLAAPIWFITTLLVTRGQRFWKRFVGLLGGVVLLVPWPFLMIGAM
ncbi:MAG: DNA polymerase III subunit gamma/tau [Microbacteriaceae bacterium]|nr:DNA polymerase III subunit gamma/tau [Microbacteriaceae bacterium]